MFLRFKNKIILFSFILISSCVALRTEAATLHAILVGDSRDRSLGTAMGSGVDSFYEGLKIAANHARLDVNIIRIVGNAVERGRVIKKIKDLAIKKNDVIVTYFAMHGYREADKTSVWPNLWFSQKGNSIPLELIIDLITAKNARLSIIISDSCNTYIEDLDRSIIDLEQTQIMALKVAKNNDKLIKNNYKKLFLDTTGLIVASASIPGEAAWGSNKLGMLMTISLLDQFNETVQQKNNVNWESIFEGIEKKINVHTERCRVALQHPQFLIETKILNN